MKIVQILIKSTASKLWSIGRLEKYWKPCYVVKADLIYCSLIMYNVYYKHVYSIISIMLLKRSIDNDYKMSGGKDFVSSDFKIFIPDQVKMCH